MENHRYTITGNPNFVLKVRDQAAKCGVLSELADDFRTIRVVCGHKTYKTIMAYAEQAVLDYNKAVENTGESESNDVK
jgi:hypothetical protein